jgi:hypothetical protein
VKQKPPPPRNTQEFVAQWHSIVATHLVATLADALGQLTAEEPYGRALNAHQSAHLAHHVAHALTIAASSTGGVEPAIAYLKQAASEQ